MKIGDRVLAKHKNGRFYSSKVLGFEEEVYYQVDFSDGSYSNNLFAQDIVVRGSNYEKSRF